MVYSGADPDLKNLVMAKDALAEAKEAREAAQQAADGVAQIMETLRCPIVQQIRVRPLRRRVVSGRCSCEGLSIHCRLSVSLWGNVTQAPALRPRITYRT